MYYNLERTSGRADQITVKKFSSEAGLLVSSKCYSRLKRLKVTLKNLLSLSVMSYEAFIDTDGGADK